jgi:hypothetical protein
VFHSHASGMGVPVVLWNFNCIYFPVSCTKLRFIIRYQINPENEGRCLIEKHALHIEEKAKRIIMPLSLKL